MDNGKDKIKEPAAIFSIEGLEYFVNLIRQTNNLEHTQDESQRKSRSYQEVNEESDAIAEILRRSRKPMHIQELRDRMEVVGLDTSQTTSRLRTAQRRYKQIKNPERGIYAWEE